jgi:hypothetical protein
MRNERQHPQDDESEVTTTHVSSRAGGTPAFRQGRSRPPGVNEPVDQLPVIIGPARRAIARSSEFSMIRLRVPSVVAWSMARPISAPDT